MQLKFQNVVLVCRQRKKRAINTLLQLAAHLAARQVRVFIEQETSQLLPKPIAEVLPPSVLGERCDLLITVGGDGSFLSAARLAARQKLPIIGVNQGDFGFLTDIAANAINQIDEILVGNFYQETRFLLQAEVVPTQTDAQHLALNDVVFLSYVNGHLIDFSVYLDDKFLCRHWANGLIVASPTGSTAHALSGGGPILLPTVDNILLVPMLSHNLGSRPIVVAGSSKIEILFKEYGANELLLICDGQTQIVPPSDRIQITKAKEELTILHPLSYDYFKILRTKLHWEFQPKNQC